MRKLAVILSLVFLSLPVFAADGWIDFSDPQGVFRVSFPASPQAANSSTKAPDGTDLPVQQYAASLDDYGVMVIVCDFMNPNLDPQTVVAGTAQAAQNQNRTLISKDVDALDGQSGLHLVLADANGNTIQDRIFFVKGKLYQVMSLAPKDVAPVSTDAISRFNASFHFN